MRGEHGGEEGHMVRDKRRLLVSMVTHRVLGQLLGSERRPCAMETPLWLPRILSELP